VNEGLIFIYLKAFVTYYFILFYFISIYETMKCSDYATSYNRVKVNNEMKGDSALI
jgi:hypothetical protein